MNLEIRYIQKMQAGVTGTMNPTYAHSSRQAKSYPCHQKSCETNQSKGIGNHIDILSGNSMASGGKPNLGASVVPDLMKVYESLTQSKTPQVLPSETASSRTSEEVASNTNVSINNSAGSGVHNAQVPVPSTATSQQPTYSQNSASQQQLHTQQHHQQQHGGMDNPFQFDPSAHLNMHPTSQPPNDIHSQQQFVYPPSLPVPIDPHATATYTTSSTVHLSTQTSATSSVASATTATAAPSKNTRPKRGSTRKRSSDTDRSGSDSDSKRKKKGGRDARWSKRFAWPDELHRDFVSAVFDVGLKHSSPSAILEQMPKHEQITSERIKSHLQKYRLHRQKSKKEFMTSYSSTLVKIKSGEIDSDPSTLNSGEVAAHLSFASMQEAELASTANTADATALMQGGVLQLPQLTDDEKRSPLGASLGYLMGLFFSLKQQLLLQRGDGGLLSHVDTSQSDKIVQDFTNLKPPGPPPAMPPPTTIQSGPSAIQPSNSNDNQSSQNVTSAVASTGANYISQQSQQPHLSQQPIMQIQQQGGGAAALSTSNQKNPQDMGKSNTGTPDSRINNPVVEESKMMKREMESQMAFQNKMRKLKEQELNKYTVQATGFGATVLPSDNLHDGDSGGTKQDDSSQRPLGVDSAAAATAAAVSAAAKGSETVGVDDADFWTSGEIMDDQLFQFLMNE